MIDRVGQQLGNYHLIRQIGHGGFAQVYLGEHIYLKTQAAIKILQVELEDDERNEFLNEARTIAHLVHPHIVRILDFGVDDNTAFLVMDYAPGGTLREFYPKGTRLPLEIIVSYIKQVAEALQYAHNQNIIHRDIKPGNILLGQNNNVLLSDFGIALIAQTSNAQSTEETVIGTIAYMAPEQIQGRPRPASDQYALGIVVYEWLCGERPFRGSFPELVTQQMSASPLSLCERIPTISSDVEEIVMTALAKDPKERFASVQAFAHALEQAYESEQRDKMKPQSSPRPTAKPTSTPRSPQQPVVMAPSSGQQMVMSTPSSSGRRVQSAKAPLRERGNQPPEQLSSGRQRISTKQSTRRVRVWSIGPRQVVGMLLGAATLGGLIILTRHIIPSQIAFSITTLFLLSLLADIALPFFGAILGPWVGLFTGVVGCLVGDYGDTFFGYANKAHDFNWYLNSTLIGLLAGLVVRGTLGRYKPVRAVTVIIVDIIGAIGIGFGIPLVVAGNSTSLTVVAIILGLIVLPILLQIYKAIAGHE